ncbi:hypothetical protein [Pseudoduganella sp. R-34]|uniref:hypothetical protein n=1 Tax=Pseudoduganella sp. R-34 TaxID=3404062 RepID=UPI003CED76CC
MKKLLAIIWGIVLGFIQVTLLLILFRLVSSNDEISALIFLLGWPALAWRNLRKPPAETKSRPSLLKRSVWALVALPIIVAVPLFAFLGSLKGQGSEIVVLVFIALLLVVTAVSWGAAMITYIVGHYRKKP